MSTSTAPDPLWFQTENSASPRPKPALVAAGDGSTGRRPHPAAGAARVLAAFLTGPVARLLGRARDLLLQLAGMALISYGVWAVYRPAGFITAGLAVLYLHWLATTDPHAAGEPAPEPGS